MPRVEKNTLKPGLEVNSPLLNDVSTKDRIKGLKLERRLVEALRVIFERRNVSANLSLHSCSIWFSEDDAENLVKALEGFVNEFTDPRMSDA